MISEKLKEKISLKKMKEILHKGGEQYTNEELVQIRDYLFELAEIDYEVFIHNEEKERKRAIESGNEKV